MKITINDNNIIVFLNHKIKINFDSKIELENYLKELFKKLNINYNLEIFGYYNVDIYLDKLYGVIISLEKEDIDYIDYDKETIDMRIVIHRKEFVYELYDIFINNYQIIKYKNKYYVKLDNDKDDYKLSNLLEHSKVIYNNLCDEVIKYGTILKNVNNMI